MTVRFAAALLILSGADVSAHRLDEYLQGTLISVEKNRLEAQMTLTPGVAVFPLLIPDFDTDGNGVISEAEQRAYAARVLRDLSLTLDGHRLALRLLSLRFPGVDEMKEGRGEIQFAFEADLPRGGRNRKLTIENHHDSRISVYQVNCLAPGDPHIRIEAQNRNYSQSHYELEYEDTDVRAEALIPGWWPDRLKWLSPFALLLLMRVTILLWPRVLRRYFRKTDMIST